MFNEERKGKEKKRKESICEIIVVWMINEQKGKERKQK